MTKVSPGQERQEVQGNSPGTMENGIIDEKMNDILITRYSSIPILRVRAVGYCACAVCKAAFAFDIFSWAFA